MKLAPHQFKENQVNWYFDVSKSAQIQEKSYFDAYIWVHSNHILVHRWLFIGILHHWPHTSLLCNSKQTQDAKIIKNYQETH